MEKIKVFVVDDHQMVRSGLIAILKEMNDLELVGEASNGREAINQVDSMAEKPEVILMDVNMPVMDGIECARELKNKHPDIKVIALTMMQQSAYIKNMLHSGAVGYLLKDCDSKELHKAILTVHKNETYYSPAVSSAVIEHLKKERSKSQDEAHFSDREKEVLQLIVQDKTNQEIADELFISVRTVESHKQNLLAKTHSNSVAGLIVYVVKHRMVEL